MRYDDRNPREASGRPSLQGSGDNAPRGYQRAPEPSRIPRDSYNRPGTNQPRPDQLPRRRRSVEPPRPANTPIGKLVVIDAVILAAALIIFALFHHVLPLNTMTSGRVLPTVTTTTVPAAVETTTPAAPEQTTVAEGETTVSAEETTTAPAPSLGGMFGDKFADKFNADGSVEKTDTTYKSGNINLTLEKHVDEEKTITWYTVDIYVRDLKYFKTAFADDTFGRSHSDETVNIANDHNAIAALSGDYCTNHQAGLVIRNGELFRESLSDQDLLVMFQDGSMKTYSRRDVDLDAIIAQGAYQSWAFGPMLLKDGQVMSEFNSTVNRSNPRSAIGYYEPGHYVFVLIDGRQDGYSVGMTTAEMSQLFYDMGCTVAYNLDGGQSAVMAWQGEVANRPYNGGRSTSDILYITDEE